MVRNENTLFEGTANKTHSLVLLECARFPIARDRNADAITHRNATKFSAGKMIAAVVAVALVTLWFFLLRPRRGGKDAPPLVTVSPVVPIPVIGVICEFFKGPNAMVKRCHRDYGPVFTIPVRRILVQVYGAATNDRLPNCDSLAIERSSLTLPFSLLL